MSYLERLLALQQAIHETTRKGNGLVRAVWCDFVDRFAGGEETQSQL
jgi:hypothetical protein